MIQIIDTSGVLHPLSNYENFHITHKQDGNDTCSFILDTSLPEYALIREEAVIRTYENEYLIKKIDDDKVDCKLNFDFLKQRFYKEYVSETKSLAEVLTRHLPTGWTIEGLNVSTIRRSIKFDLCTDYDVIMDCIDTYGVYFIWHILAKRLVVVKPDLMNPTGEYVTSELNLRKLSFKGKSVDFATRLYAYGKDGMTMEDAIINGQRYGLEYVENTTYSNKLIIAYWKDERYTVPENLHDDAVKKLDGLSWPVRSYECKIDDLAKQDERYSFLDFAMHKVISLLDSDRGIAVNHQIVEYDEWPDEPRENSVTLSCVAGTIQDRIRKAADNGGKDAAEAVRQELESFINGEYADDLEDIQTQLDGKAETWYQAADPSTGWTDDEKTEHTGDLWYKTTDSTTWRWTGSAWAQQNVPDAVFNKIEGKAQVFVSQPVPPYNVGDLWVQGSTGDIKRCQTAKTASGSYAAADWILASKYTDDSALTAFLTGTYASDIQNLETQIDGKAETWYQTSDPSTAWTTAALRSEHVGDLWYNSTSSVQKYYRWNGTSWAEMTATPPQAVFDQIDGKAQIFVSQPTPPYSVGDLWVQGSTGDIKRCSTARATGSYTASDWTLASKYTDDSALTNWLTNTYATDKSNLQSQIDGKVQTYSQSSDPATSWTSADDKAKHVGDLWYNTSSQKYYRYKVSGTTYSWEEITATPPSSVVTVINSKAQIFTAQPTPPYNIGDLWFNSTTSDIMTCITARASGSYTASDWQKRNKYTDDSAAEQVQENLEEAVETLETQITQGDSAVSAALAERLNVATAMLTSAFGNYCYSDNGELFMMDNPDPAQATIVWRWNVNGFGKSSTGIDGPYTTALTFDDTFITGIVNAMIIRGDLIEANSISAEKIKQTYTDGVLSSAFTAAQGYVDALFVDLNNYLTNTDGTGQLDVLQEDIAEIQATINGLNIDFSEAFRGGINYAHNSAGLNGMSDDWTKTGTVVTMQSNDTKNSTVSNSCFRLSTDAELSQTIDNVVLGQPYTISCKVKKTGTLLSEVYVVYNGGTVGKLFSASVTSGWADYKFTIDAIASNTLQIVATTRSDYLYVSDIMVCEGVTSKAWTPAPDEIYTSGVKIDKRGITVYRSGTNERTVINNEEFAGYNGDTEIFSLNGDETRIVNAIVRQQLRIEDTIFIPFDSGGEKGLNIALID